MNVLVEGFDADSRALAQFLAREGNDVRLASPAPETPAVAELRDLGITVEPASSLDRDPGSADVAFLDVWTPAAAQRVQRLRAQGTQVSCLADLLLERWRGRTIGITGTAGKTTTTSLVASILRAAGTDVAVSAGARAGNLWPTGELLDLLAGPAETNQVLLVELTSSHLAFMHRSPTIGAVVSFWPDHLELHGDLDHYRDAKATIARQQGINDALVLNADDAAACFAAETPGCVVEFSLRHPVSRGAYLRSDSRLVFVGNDGSEASIGATLDGAAHPGNILAAAAIAWTAGASPSDVALGIEEAPSLLYRARHLHTFHGIPVVDDGMAATPTKTKALLVRYPRQSIVLIAGGGDDAGGGPVHATREETALLHRACDEVARVARCVVLFGVGGARLESLLSERAVELLVTDDLASAVAAAALRSAGAAAIVFSPLFPVTLDERAGFEALVAMQR